MCKPLALAPAWRYEFSMLHRLKAHQPQQHPCPRARPVNRSPLSCRAVIQDVSLAHLGTDLGWRTDFDRHYVKGKVLGNGSFGMVYLGIDLKSGEEVAVKVLPKVRGKLSKERTLDKIEREVEMMEILGDHDGMVHIRACFESEHEVMLVTELCSGGDLQRLLDAQGFINERALVLIAYEVLKLVKVCHTHGILHGDIKPANFLMKHRQRNPLFSSDASLLHLPWLKMVDFGCSQLLEPDHRFTKRSGTPVYMAPEIFERNYHAEADLWSLGIMLYQLYAQRFPYWPTKDGCKDSNLDQVMAAVLETPIALDYGPWLNMSPAGRDFVSRCLVKDYSKRLTVDEGLQHAWFADVRAAIAAAPKPGAAAAHAGAAHVPPPATSVFASSNNIVAHAMPGAAVAAVPGLSGMVTAGAHI